MCDVDDDIVCICQDPIPCEKFYSFVNVPSCGGIVQFNGVTRQDTSPIDPNVKVSHLEYECYTPMAVNEMRAIVKNLRKTWPDICRIAMVHRIGRVDVGDSSVFISISSAHRNILFAALEFAIDSLKASVPIWKKEFYSVECNEPKWKSNKECFWLEK